MPGRRFLVTVSSLPSLGDVQTASAVLITSGRADVSVVVTSQDDLSMSAETSIQYVMAPEVTSAQVFFFFITLGLQLSDTKVYEPEIRALLGTASHFCEAVVN